MDPRNPNTAQRNIAASQEIFFQAPGVPYAGFLDINPFMAEAGANQRAPFLPLRHSPIFQSLPWIFSTPIIEFLAKLEFWSWLR